MLTNPPTITWDTLRTGLAGVRRIGQTYLAGQVWLGWQLAFLKDQHRRAGGGRGGDRKSIGQSGSLISWADLVAQETDLSARTADRLIALFDATMAKLKRMKKPILAKAYLEAFEGENPLTVLADQGEDLMAVIATLCDGETQKSLLLELKVISPPRELTGGDTSKNRKAPEDLPAGQLAFSFFAPLATDLTKLRSSPDYHAFLHALPVVSSSENELSLTDLEIQLSSALQDVKAAKKARATA